MPASVQFHFSSATMAGSTTPSELKAPAETRKNRRHRAAKLSQGLAGTDRWGVSDTKGS